MSELLLRLWFDGCGVVHDRRIQSIYRSVRCQTPPLGCMVTYVYMAALSKGKAATFLCSAAGEGDWTTLQTLLE
jgi:hypothetical protein